MEKYFKIIELPTHQVLFTRDFDEDENPTIKVSVYLDGVRIDISAGYQSEEKRDEIFENNINEEVAQAYLNSILDMLEDAE